MRYRIRRYGSRWVVVNGKHPAVFNYHRYWVGAFWELLRLQGWL